jgi:multidrug efflux pump subunit AcrB
MKSIFRFFAERHLLANIITLMIIVVGVFTLFRLNRSEWPKVDIGVVEITTQYPGASPEDVELNVTNKIEDELKGISGIKEITSISMENMSYIHVEVDPDYSDREKVKTEIREAVARVNDLPEEVTKNPFIFEVKTTLMPIIEVGMSSDELSYAELRESARQFEKKLKDIPGIAQVYRNGYRAREVRIEVSPKKMIDYHVPMNDIVNAIKSRNIKSSGGSLESYTSERNVVTLAEFNDPMEVGDVIIRSTFEGNSVRVKDLAVIYDDFEEEKIIPRMNGKKAISFVVTKSENSDIIRTVKSIKKLVKSEKKYMPEGVEFLYTKDSSKNVENKFKIVSSNGLIGLILVLIVLSLFLSIRSSFWVALGIPLSLLGTLIILPIFDIQLDGITLTSLILIIGIIVDDAIVIAENIFQRREKGDLPLKAAVNGISEVYMPVFTTVLTTFIAFLPMFFLGGEIGDFIRVLPITVSLALFLSLFESFFLLPAHITPTLKENGKKKTFGRKWFNPVREKFKKIVSAVLKFRYLTLLAGVIILSVAILFAFTKMKFILFPSKGSTAFVLNIQMPLGSSIYATNDKIEEIEDIIKRLPESEVESFSSKVGKLEGHDETEGEHLASINVNLTPFNKRKRTADEIVEEVRDKISIIKGLDDYYFSIDTGTGPSGGKPIQIMIIGADDELRIKLVDDIFNYLQAVEGVKDIDRDDKLGKEEIKIKIFFDKLARYGLTVSDIAQNVRIAYDGQDVTSIRYGEEDVDFKVILDKEFRKDLNYLNKLRISNNKGELVALEEVAYLDIGPGASIYHHVDGERSTIISADIEQDTSTSLTVNNKVLEKYLPVLSKDYPGISLKISGEGEETERAAFDIMFTFIFAVLGIYCLLILLFNSLTQPLIVILSIPFGISGVILAFFLHNEPFSFLGMLGIIGMAGVVVNDSLVLVNHLNNIIRVNGVRKDKKKVLELIAVGTSERLRPIILTSITTVVGLLPLAYGLGGRDIYMAPMALSLGYGILFATPITLLIIPSLYMIGQDLNGLFIKIFKK